MHSSGDFFSMYFSYTDNTEVPPFFNRWAAITGIGAFLGRQYSLSHGHFLLHPNIYCMLIGSPGTRKSTSIKLIKNLIQQAGYSTIAADKTTKEKFLLDLSGHDELETKALDLATTNIFGEDDGGEPKEMFIAADEFNDFIGNGNIEFISLLGTMWDYNGTYRNRIKNGKSVSIHDPTISILGGNTPTGFSLAFPTDILGQGFFSRLLLVYGEPTGKKIAFPAAPPAELTKELIATLMYIKSNVIGRADISNTALKLLEKIYTHWEGIDDVRFDSYSNRRFTHLLKLCLITSAARCSNKITEQDVVYANTILAHTEHLMPKALGEFGKAKHADVAHKIMMLLYAATTPVTVATIWQAVVQDLEKISDLADILRNLSYAKKIQAVDGCYLPKRKVLQEVSTDMVDYSMLNKEEIQT